ncbi:hypothetical protein ACX9NE_16100 [Mycobacterium sp. ML4]
MLNVPPPPAWAPVAQSAGSRPSRVLPLLSLGIALLAIGIAIGAWFRPLPKNEPPPAPTYSTQQVADAKAKVCAAYAKVHSALELSAERTGGSDPTGVLAVATSGRQVLDAGSRYLSTKLSEAPATPTELALTVRKLASAYQELTIGYLDGLTNADQELKSSLQAADDATSVLERICT